MKMRKSVFVQHTGFPIERLYVWVCARMHCMCNNHIILTWYICIYISSKWYVYMRYVYTCHIEKGIYLTAKLAFKHKYTHVHQLKHANTHTHTNANWLFSSISYVKTSPYIYSQKSDGGGAALPHNTKRPTGN